jgi:hypothetical protein
VVSSLSEQLVARSGEFRFGEQREVTLKGMTRAQPAATLLWADEVHHSHTADGT